MRRSASRADPSRLLATVPCEVNKAQNYLQTEGLNIHQCAKKIRASQTVLEAKREEFMEEALIYAKSRVTAEICERFQQLQNLTQKYAFLRPEVILSMDELNLDQTPKDKEEFQLERVLLQVFVAATDLGSKKELLLFCRIMKKK
ncbi:uncharacterized protein TNCV_3478691 [Trichonephila clavipes]|nr:uncharacterized protein TNCV_3478691 [Trichonephila clavipes]